MGFPVILLSGRSNLASRSFELNTVWIKYESLAGRDRVWDSNSDSETGLDIKKAKRNKKMLHTLRECLTEPFWETTESKKINKLNPYCIIMLQTCLWNDYPVRSSGKSSSRSGASPPRTNLTREKSSEVPVVVGPSEGRYPSALFLSRFVFVFVICSSKHPSTWWKIK